MIVISVRFALLLKDDFSASIVADGGQRFFVNGRPFRPVRKSEGFFVFTAPPGAAHEDHWDVRIESARYFPRTVHIEASALAPGLPLRTVQMYRKPHSGFSDCQWMETFAPPGLLAVAILPQDPPLELKEFCGDTMRLRGYTAKNLLGRRVCIGKGKRAELFTFTSRLPDGSYGVDHAPVHSHKEGESVYLVACAPGNEAGRCSIPIHADENPLQIRYYDEEAMRWQEI